MPTPVFLKYTLTRTNDPEADPPSAEFLGEGELAINTATSLIYFKNAAGNVGILSPAPHSSSHATGGADELTPDAIGAIPSTEKGANNGVAVLDSGGKLPISQLPTSAMEYKGTWNPSTNTPALANGTGTNGDVYLASDAGTVNFGAGNITFATGDWTIYNGSIWEKTINTNAVVSVNSQTGAVTLTKTDIGLDNIDNTADADKPVSTAQQTALDLKQNILVNAVRVTGAGTPDVNGVYVPDGVHDGYTLYRNIRFRDNTIYANENDQVPSWILYFGSGAVPYPAYYTDAGVSPPWSNTWYEDEGALPVPTLTQATVEQVQEALATEKASTNDLNGLSNKVEVPVNQGTPGSFGDWSLGGIFFYVYTGDGTNHSWLQIAGATTFDNS